VPWISLSIPKFERFDEMASSSATLMMWKPRRMIGEIHRDPVSAKAPDRRDGLC
jgi:hypothetical protein